MNGGEAIKNNILYGSVRGPKIDRETESVIAGTAFGLFRSNETEFTYTNAILTAESDKDGIFTFGSVPYDSWIIKELKPAKGYLPNDEIYTVTIDADGQLVEITVTNNRVPEIPHSPKTGDNSKLGFWIGLAAVALGGVISAGIIRIKSRKDDDE